MLRFTWIMAAFLVFATGCSNQEYVESTRPEQQPPTIEESDEATFSASESAFGQRIYVPTYTHVYYNADRRSVDLLTTLSVRNTDADHAIMLQSVSYYDFDGKLVWQHLEEPLELPPMASREFLADQPGLVGESGASFVVEWVSEHQVSDPVVEAVMVGTQSGWGISFVRTGRVLETHPRREASTGVDTGRFASN